MAAKLTSGAIGDILSGKDVESPVLQVISFKVIQAGAQGRYRMLVSDGKYSTASSMLATQLNSMVNNELKPFSIFRVDRFVCNTVNDSKKVLIVLDLTVVSTGDAVGGILGSPEPFEASRSGAPAKKADDPPARPNFNREPKNMNQSSSAGGFGASPARPSGAPVGVHPIASLTPYQNKWTICARVTNKSAIRTWSNSRGEGKLFSMDLLDESGEIKATAFKEQCDKFYNMIEPNKVYYISQAQLKTANKQYSSLKNDYEMTFNQATQVTLCEERTSIPAMQFEFVSIDQIEKIDKETTIDVIGVCRECHEINTVTTKATGQELKKRDLQIVDDSNSEIRLTLWGAQAETFDGSLNPILAVKGAKVSDFNGKSLSVLASSMVQINPDIKESHKLRAWYENAGGEIQTQNLSNQRSGAGSFGDLKTIAESVIENLGCHDQADYYTTKATAIFFRKENYLYSACPSDNCNKKVVDMNNGVYRCEKCQKEFDSFKWRLMLSANVADLSENVWTTLFQEQAEQLLGCTSSHLGDMKDTDENGVRDIFNEAAFKEYVFKIRVKMETYNDENRLKSSVVSVQPLDCRDYNKKLIQQIKTLSGCLNI